MDFDFRRSKFLALSGDYASADVGKNFQAFRRLYPEGENIIVANNIETMFKKKYEDITITFVNTQDLIKKIA